MADYKLSVDSKGKTIKLNGSAVLKYLNYTVYETEREMGETSGALSGNESVIANEVEKIKGQDGAGRYTGVLRSFKSDYIDKRDRHWDFAHGSLEVRVYDDFVAVKTKCDLERTLKEDGHFRVEIGSLPGMESLLGLHMFSDWWSRPHVSPDLATLPARTQMLLWQLEGGSYGCIVPVISGGCRCVLNGRTGKLGADLTFIDGYHNNSEAFAFVAAFGDDPYELVARCVERGMAVTGRPGKLRFEKPLPEIWNSIGWCTWNAMYSGVNEKDVLTKLREFRAEAFPVQYVLIDDGWSPLEGRELASFDINIEKFPSGLKGFVNTVKSDFNVQQVGFWHAFTGYWQGVSTKSPLYSEQKDNLLKTKRGSHIPYPEAQKSFGFWNGWHSHLRQQGVDFVKVDNQGATWHHSRGTMPVGDAAKGQQYGLQASIGLNFSDRAINCMCMANDCIWHWTSSNVARNSDDFFPDSLPSHCEHARQNIYNNLFYANFAWPDWDMFWSYHPQATYHAALRAISGGPVYFTDEVGKANWDILRPFITTNGHLLKCRQPAMPTRDTLFVNPYEDKKAVKAFNTVGDAGMVLAVNALNVEDSVQGDVKPSDVEGLKGDLFAVREYFTGQTRLLGRNDSWPLELGVYEPLLFTFARVDNGLAVIGLANKYVSHAAVQKITMLNNSAVISLAEGGDLLLYLEKPAKAIRTIAGNISGHANEGWMTVPVVSDEPVDVFVEW